MRHDRSLAKHTYARALQAPLQRAFAVEDGLPDLMRRLLAEIDAPGMNQTAALVAVDERGCDVETAAQDLA